MSVYGSFNSTKSKHNKQEYIPSIRKFYESCFE